TEEAVVVTETASAATREATAAANELTKATEAQATALEALRNRLVPGRRETVQLARDMQTLTLAIAMGTGNIAQNIQMMGLLQQEYINAQKDTEDLATKTVEAAFTMEGAFDELRLNGLRRLDDGFADLWRGAIDGSRSASETMKRVLDQTLAELAHMAITRPIIVEMQSMMGMGGGQQGAMNSQGMSLQNINPGMLQRGWDTASGWFGGGGTAAASGGGLYANAATQSAGTLYGSAQTGASAGGLYGNAVTGGVAQGGGWMGGSMQNYQGMTAVYNAGAAMAGGYVGGEVGSSVTGKTANSNYGETAGSLVGSYWGPWGAAAGSAIGSFVDSLFGSNKKTFDFDFVQGAQPGIFGDRSSALGDFGIAKFSDYKLGEQQDSLQELMDSIAIFDDTLANSAIDERVDAMRASIEGFTHSGPENLFNTRLRAIIDGSGAYVESAIAQIADPEQMANAFVAVLNLERIAQSLNEQIQRDVIDHLEANTGDVQGTANGLFQALDAIALLGNSIERLNLQFDATAEGAIHSAWSLQNAVGGIETLTAVNDAYYQAAFSESERLSNAQQDLATSLSGVTDEIPKTVDELRALVEAQNLNTDAGGRLAYELMALAPALKETSGAVRQAIEQQYQEMLGRAPEADGLEHWFNAVASGSLSLTDALDFIANSAEAAEYAANGAADGLNSVADVLREREQLERQRLTLEGNTAELRRRDLEATDESNRPLQQRVWALQDEQDRLRNLDRQQQERVRSINQERDALARAKQQLAGFTNSIDGWLANLRGTEAGLSSPADQLAATSQAFYEQYDKALGGDRDAMNSITQYADRFIKAQKGWGASGSETTATIDKVAGMLERLPAQLSAEQFLADEFKDALAQQTTALGVMLDLNGDGTVSAIERAITAGWSTNDV
ncbi:DUF4214 domain-containing protein, partial [Halomonas citrativorans]|uniref:DUF4214 domain-containing protein n=1 Tax=Halomonas citrativorans TaxID=2742612 RepID=UPI00111E2E27